VIGIASGRHAEFLRGLGVAQFVNRDTTDFTEVVRDVDHVVDTVGGPDGHRFLDVVRRGGTISPIYLGEYHRDRAAELDVRFVGQQVRSHGEHMAELAALLGSGQLRVGIDSTFPLVEASRAHERGEQGHLQGKIVLRVRD
jgi:NADPH:quinone reductase-like Zn-dependent oxidoreductase